MAALALLQSAPLVLQGSPIVGALSHRSSIVGAAILWNHQRADNTEANRTENHFESICEDWAIHGRYEFGVQELLHFQHGMFRKNMKGLTIFWFSAIQSGCDCR